MLTNAKTRIVLAIVGVLFLLFNPAGVCAGTPDSQSQSHPCCPQGPAQPQHDATAKSCVCIDRQPAAPTAPSATDDAQPVAATPAVAPAAEAAPAEFAVPEAPISPPRDLSVEFHQLLV